MSRPITYTGHVRWSKEEELKLIKSISKGKSIESLATEHKRTNTAIELRLKKIIYENIMSGKDSRYLSKMLSLPEEQIENYFNSYKDFYEKNKQLIIKKEKVEKQTGSGKKSDSFNTKIENNIKRLEKENQVMKLIVENKELNKKINQLIDDKKLDSSIKKIIKNIS